MAIKLYDDGADVIRVEEYDAAGKLLRSATGWKSATTNVVIDDTRDPANPEHRVHDTGPGVNRRSMTTAELQAYADQLLDEQNPPPDVPPAIKPFASF